MAKINGIQTRDKIFKQHLDMTLIKKALILEDDPIASVLIRLTIDSSNLVEETTVVPNGKEGMAYLQMLSPDDSYPDIILLDLNMPIMNGFEFLSALENYLKGKEIPVFILTSSIDEEDRHRAETYTCVKGFLVKPMKKNNLKIIEQWFIENTNTK